MGDHQQKVMVLWRKKPITHEQVFKIVTTQNLNSGFDTCNQHFKYKNL